MIQRRHFLGSTALTALGLAANPALLLGKSSPPVPDMLDWESRKIATVRDTRATRRPVVTGVSLQREGRLIATVGDDHLISLYDFKTGLFVRHLRRHTDWVRAAVFSADSKNLFTCSHDRNLIRWDISDQTATAKPLVLQREAIINLAVSHDSEKVASVGHSKFAFVHNVEGQQLSRLPCSCDDNHAVAFSMDDSLLAVGGRCGTIRVFDLKTGSVAHQIKAHRRRIRGLEFNSSDELVSVGEDQVVRINRLDDTNGSHQLPRMATKLYAVHTIAPSTIATSGSDNLIHIWDIRNRSEIGVLEGHAGTVTCMDMAQNVFVSGSYDATFRIWIPRTDEVAMVQPNQDASSMASRGTRQPSAWQARR